MKQAHNDERPPEDNELVGVDGNPYPPSSLAAQMWRIEYYIKRCEALVPRHRDFFAEEYFENEFDDTGKGASPF